MEFKQIRQIHKELQKLAKQNSDDRNSVFIRHWNVFYNQLRGRDISIIEQTSRTPLYGKFVQELGTIFNHQLPLIEVSYSSDESLPYYILGCELKKVLDEKVKELSETKEACHE